MAKIEGLRIKNFKLLKDVTLGRLWNQSNSQPLTPMTAVIGKNGVGKSVLFDAFGFLSDALKLGVEEACDARGRGGFEKMRTQGETGPIEFEVSYRQQRNTRPITYQIAIELDTSGRPYVSREYLRQRRRGQGNDLPLFFLFLLEGQGMAWKGNQAVGQIGEIEEGFDIFEWAKSMKEGGEFKDAEHVELEDQRKLGIATLGALKQHPRISAFRRFIEGWYLSYFTPDAARSPATSRPTEPSQHPWRQSRQRRAIYGARTSTAFSGYAKEDCRENSGYTQDRHGKN